MELGELPSYLSQGRHVKRPASHGVLSSVRQNVKQNDIMSADFECGEVSELADEHDLGSEIRSCQLTV
jgi:hypothetical protein